MGNKLEFREQIFASTERKLLKARFNENRGKKEILLN